MARKPQSVPEITSALAWAAEGYTRSSYIKLIIVPEGPDNAAHYVGAELHVCCSDGSDWVLRRSTERCSARSDQQIVGALFRSAMRVRTYQEPLSDEDMVRLADWEKGAAKLRSAKA